MIPHRGLKGQEIIGSEAKKGEKRNLTNIQIYPVFENYP